MDFSVWMAIGHMLGLRLSLTLAPPPSPPLLITFYEKHHYTSPGVHLGNKVEEELLQR
jgi:hypothetical protein